MLPNHRPPYLGYVMLLQHCSIRFQENWANWFIFLELFLELHVFLPTRHTLPGLWNYCTMIPIHIPVVCWINPD